MTATQTVGTESVNRYSDYAPSPDMPWRRQADFVTALAVQGGFSDQDRHDAAAMLLRHAQWKAQYSNADHAEVANLLAMADLHLRLADTSPATP